MNAIDSDFEPSFPQRILRAVARSAEFMQRVAKLRKDRDPETRETQLEFRFEP